MRCYYQLLIETSALKELLVQMRWWSWRRRTLLILVLWSERREFRKLFRRSLSNSILQYRAPEKGRCMWSCLPWEQICESRCPFSTVSVLSLCHPIQHVHGTYNKIKKIKKIKNKEDKRDNTINIDDATSFLRICNIRIQGIANISRLSIARSLVEEDFTSSSFPPRSRLMQL